MAPRRDHTWDVRDPVERGDSLGFSNGALSDRVLELLAESEPQLLVAVVPTAPCALASAREEHVLGHSRSLFLRSDLLLWMKSKMPILAAPSSG